jgi:hypothetical protein
MTRRTELTALALVIALAVGASVSGITNGFAFDDVHIIVDDNRTHSLAHWWQFFAQSYWPLEKSGDLYRPLTMLGFAIQWALSGGAPLVFHVVSVVLYALVCAAFFGILLELLPLGAAWLGAALFAVHPLHVEAVANVVGQAELLAALFMFLALLVFLRSRRRGAVTIRDTGVMVLLYIIACLSKEHAIVLPLLIIAADLTVTAKQSPLQTRIATIRPLISLMTAVGLAFIWIRFRVLGAAASAPDEANALLAGQPFAIRAMTMLRVLLEWVRLFFWPAHLSADYAPRHIDIVTGPTLEMLASASILFGVAGLAWISRRTSPAATFAVLWVAIALIIPSNLFVNTGFVLAERTLFVASAGAVLGVVAVLTQVVPDVRALSPRSRAVAFAVVGMVLVLGLTRSALRQRVWRDNETLFSQTVRDAPASYKAHLAYSTVLFDHRRRREAFEEIQLAHSLFPKDFGVLEYAAEKYSQVEGCERAVGLFRTVLADDPGRARSRMGLASCLIAMGQHEDARKTISLGLAIGKSKQPLQQLMAINDSVEAAVRLRKRN